MRTIFVNMAACGPGGRATHQTGGSRAKTRILTGSHDHCSWLSWLMQEDGHEPHDVELSDMTGRLGGNQMDAPVKATPRHGRCATFAHTMMGSDAFQPGAAMRIQVRLIQ